MPYSTPESNWNAGEILGAAEVNKLADNEIFLAGLLSNEVALSALGDGAELHYDMAFENTNDTTERSHAIAGTGFETHSTATKRVITAVSTRPIVVLCNAKCKVSSGTIAYQLFKFNGGGGTEYTLKHTFANTSYNQRGDWFICVLESPVKGNSYTFAFQVFDGSGTLTAYIDEANWFAFSL